MADETNQQDRKRQKDDQRSQLPSSGSGQSRGTMLIWIVAVTLLALWAWSYLYTPAGGPQISYSEFRQQLQDDNIQEVTVEGEQIRGMLRESATRITAQEDTVEYTEFSTHMPSFGDERLMEELEARGVDISAEPESDFPWGLLIIGLLPILLILGIGYIILRRMQSQGQGLFSVRESKAEMFDKEKADTTFDDVAGNEEAKTELQEVITFLQEPERFEELGGKVPKGVLLVGPPGTGKTLMARAVAGEAGVPFFSVSGSDFMEMFVGVGAARVRDMFDEAKEESPSIIFVDELDSIGRKRGAGMGGGHDEREQTLNQLLAELDGFEKNEGVIVMAATNRPDILDSALTRPGRFDRQVTVDLPTAKARKQILEIHARNKPIDEEIDLGRLARNTPGFSGADLENLLNEAALLAGRSERKRIKQEDIEEARDKVIMGLKREGLVLSEEERRLLAYHEAGHAIVAAALPYADTVHKVTIVPRGKAMGVTQQMPEEDKYLYHREYILDRLAVIMGGRAAEELIFDTATSGAENDLKQVRKMARKMVLDWGMGERFKHVALGDEQGQVFLGEELGQGRSYSDQTAREVDDEVRGITERAFERAIDTLRENRQAFDHLAELLLKHEEVSGEKVASLLNGEAEDPEAAVDEAQNDGESVSKEPGGDGLQDGPPVPESQQPDADEESPEEGQEKSEQEKD